MASCDDQIVPVKKRKFTWYSNFFEDVLAQLPENQVAMLSNRRTMLQKAFDGLTLPRFESGRFFVPPDGAMSTLAVWAQEAVCPEAFHGEPCVPVCPTVRSSAFCKIFLAAL